MGPGEYYQRSVSLEYILSLFPDDATAQRWLESRRWPQGPQCPKCGSMNVLQGAKHKSMPYRCRERACKQRFSVKMGTVMERGKLGYQTWVVAMFLLLTSREGVSATRLTAALGITPKSAWHLAQRIRGAWAVSGTPLTGLAR